MVREEHEMTAEYARRAAEEFGEPGVGQLGEIYLYSRFRKAVPAELVQEFDTLGLLALRVPNV